MLKFNNAFVYPVPPLVTVTEVTSPPVIVTEASPPLPSPRIGTLETVPVVAPPCRTYPDPLDLITTVSIFPSIEAPLTAAVVTSPQFPGTGIYFYVVKLMMSAGEIVNRYFHK